MKRIILILIFVIVFSNLTNAGLYPISMADFIYPTCNNNGRCDYFESSKNCPNECNANTNPATVIMTSTTSTSSTVEEINEPANVVGNGDNNMIDQNQASNTLTDENQPIINLNKPIKKEGFKISWNLILSFVFVIGIIFFVALLYFWIKGKPKVSRLSIGRGKVKIVGEEDEFGLPSRPKRGFGI